MLIDMLVDALDKMIWTDERIGKYGEMLTAQKLMLTNLLGEKGRILRNIYLPKENGETSEIDMVFITQKGIFVIESKNYSGWIFGRESDQYWTQSMPNRAKYRFYNPIKQNRTHIKWLNEFLEQELPLFSIIVFSERCKLKNISYRDENVRVMQRGELRSAIKEIWKTAPDVLSKEEIAALYEKLKPLTNATDSVKQAHIESIQKKYEKSGSKPVEKEESPAKLPPVQEISDEPKAAPAEENIVNAETSATEEKVPVPEVQEHPEPLPEPVQSELLCPKCGAKLILRTAKKGDHAGNRFYGCSGFPKCRYIQNITSSESST